MRTEMQPRPAELLEGILWTTQRFRYLHLGRGRDASFRQLMACLRARPTAAINQACKGNASLRKFAYRMCNNPDIDPTTIVDAFAKGFIDDARIAAQRLLVVADCTAMIYKRKGLADQLGNVGGPTNTTQRGFFSMAAIGVDATCGEVFGLFDLHSWIRPTQPSTRHARKDRDYRDKETVKWEASLRRIQERADGLEYTYVADREADVHELLAYIATQPNVHFVIRAGQLHRRVTDEDAMVTHLREAAKAAPILGYKTVRVAQRGAVSGHKPKKARDERTVRLALRGASVTFDPPRKPKRGEARKPIAVNVVLASEERDDVERDDVAVDANGDADANAPLEWVLVTDHPVATKADLLQAVNDYEQRWLIEEFFQCWKTGTAAEDRTQHSAQALMTTVTLLAPIAVQLLRMKTLSRRSPDASCEHVVARTEWQCLWQMQGKPLPSRPPGIREFIHALARDAGWQPTKRYPDPGWKKLWQAYNYFRPFYTGWLLAQARPQT